VGGDRGEGEETVRLHPDPGRSPEL
jgi:hypothetical protein